MSRETAGAERQDIWDSIGGLGIAGFLPADVAYEFMIATALAGALLTTWGVPSRLTNSRPEAAKVRDHNVFVRVFVARFGLMFGQTLLMTYVLFFFRDVLHVARPAREPPSSQGLPWPGR
ncbi:MAG: hypothetical protein M0Z36_03640 [Thermaerobacter sp.]|nr:hypothetical protein [Thermaerobacter sp.]